MLTSRQHDGFSWQHDQVGLCYAPRVAPDILVNGRADMPEDFHSREGEGRLGNFDAQRPWELCVTIAGAWSYPPNKPPKPLKDYIQLPAELGGSDGKLLLNVGPARSIPGARHGKTLFPVSGGTP